jgi:SpoVK/Ycf46/Vps4 family AAA+-type ATPase
MRKAKKKSGSRKNKPQGKAKILEASALEKRLDAEFAKCVTTAKSYLENPQRLRSLFTEAAKQAAAIPKEPFAETWA